jgi:hypothetical protein
MFGIRNTREKSNVSDNHRKSASGQTGFTRLHDAAGKGQKQTLRPIQLDRSDSIDIRQQRGV